MYIIYVAEWHSSSIGSVGLNARTVMMTSMILVTIGCSQGMGEPGAQGGGEEPTELEEEVEEWED